MTIDVTETVEDRCNDYINIYGMKKLCRSHRYTKYRLFAEDDIFKKERRGGFNHSRHRRRRNRRNHFNPRRKYALNEECKDACNAVRSKLSTQIDISSNSLILIKE